MLFDTSLCIDCLDYYFSYNFCFSCNFKYSYRRVAIMSSLKAVIDFRKRLWKFQCSTKKKNSQMMSQLSSPVWSLLHAAPRKQAALLWLLLYDPIFTFRNGIIFSEGPNNFGPFALVQRHCREHHGQSMIGSCSSAGSAEWRWGRRRVHDLAHGRDCGENTGGIPDQDLISAWGEKTLV